MVGFFNITIFNFIFTQIEALHTGNLDIFTFVNWNIFKHFEVNVAKSCFSLIEFDGFQIKLLKGLLLILFSNVILIYFTWRIYGKRISNRFMKTGEIQLLSRVRLLFFALGGYIFCDLTFDFLGYSL